MRFLLFFLMILCVSKNFSQQNNNQDEFKKAKKLYLQGNYQQAYNIYQRIISDTNAINTFYSSGAQAAAKLGLRDTAFNWLYKYREATPNPQRSWIVNNIPELRTDDRWNTYLHSLQNKRDNYSEKKGYNVALRRTLELIKEEDQKVRYDFNYVNSLPDKKLSLLDSIKKEWIKVDSINLKKITNILDQYGWVTKSEVGDASYTQWLVLQHAPTHVKKKYFPIMKKAVESGELSKADLAIMIDRINIEEGKKQIYGSQIGHYKEIKYILPLEDPDNVNNRRLNVGLTSIEEYLKFFGLIWNVEDYKKSLSKYEQWFKENSK